MKIVAIKTRTDFINHPYLMVVDVVERGRRTRVVKCYDNMLGPPYTYTGRPGAPGEPLQTSIGTRFLGDGA